MASNGAGVNLDNIAAPLHFTWYDENNADFQNDGLGNFQMDFHKLWACMGRAGINGIMRNGFVELGNGFTGAPSCFIEPVAGAVLGGANLWNTNVAYNPLGGIAAVGDWCAFGCLEVPRGLALHLGAALLGQPVFDVEVLTALTAGNYNPGVWTNINANIIRTPDFTQANGRALQRLEFDPFTSWNAFLPADAIGTGALSAYYIFRLKLVAPIAAAPAANTAYRDWLYGYFKRYFSQYATKEMDDTAGTNASNFWDRGLFSLHFRTGNGIKSDAVLTCDYKIGELGANNRPTARVPWVISGDTAPSWNMAKGYGGTVIVRGKFKGSGGGVTFIRGTTGDGELIDMRLWGLFNVLNIGAGGGQFPMKKIEWVRVTPDFDNMSPGVSIVSGFNLDASGYSRDFMVDGARGKSVQSLLKSTIASARFYGTTFTDDDVSGGQINPSGTGNKELYGIQWGGPNNKMAGVPPGRDRRKLLFYIFDLGTQAPLSNIRVTFTDSIGIFQTTGTSDINGLVTWPGAGALVEPNSQSSIPVSKRESDPGPTFDVDSYMRVDVNRTADPEYNSAFLTYAFYMKMPRAFLYDNALGAYAYQDWQPQAGAVYLGLPRAPVPLPTPPGSYVRQPVPDTDYSPVDQVVTPFEALPQIITPFVRAVNPETGYTPCDEPPISTPFTRQPEASTDFEHLLIPSTAYSDCDAEAVDRFILLGPWMPKRISGGP